MNQKDRAALRLDRRLASRRGWIQDGELDAEFSKLPDVSDKIAPPEDEAPPAPVEQAPPPAPLFRSDPDPPTFE